MGRDNTKTRFARKKKKNNSPDYFLRATEHTQNIKFGLYNHITKFW